MKKELNIISEIFRMREIMGVGTLSYSSKKYIQEQTNDMSKYLLTEATVQPDPAAMARLFKVLGMDDATAVIFGRSIADNWDAGAKEFIELLEKNGLDDITKLQGKIAAIRGIDVSTVTKEMVDDAMAKFFKNNTDLAEEILKSNSDFVKNSLAGKSFADILRTVDAQLGQGIDDFVRNTDITSANAGTLKGDLLNISNMFKNSGLDMNDATNKEFADLLDDYRYAAEALDGSSTKIKEPTPDAVFIPKEEMGNQKTIKQQQDLDDAAAEQKRIDDEASQRSANEAADSQRLQNIKDERLGDVIPTLKSDANYKEAFSFITRVLSYFKLGSAADFLAKAERQFSNMSINDLMNFQTSTTYKNLTDELKIKAEGRNAKVGKSTEKATKRLSAYTKFMKTMEEFFIAWPVLGFLYKVLKAIFSMYLLYLCLRNFEFVNDFTENLKLFLLGVISNVLPIDDPRTTLPNCLKYIYGYYDLPMEVRNDVNTIGLTCDNLKQDDPTNFASSIVFVKGGTKMDNTGNKVTTKDKFVVKIGGKEVPFEIGGGITPPTPSPTPPTTTPSNTYTNTQDDFIRWVNANHPGKYGSDYEWDGTAGYYYPSGGNEGNAMTFSSSGWE